MRKGIAIVFLAVFLVSFIPGSVHADVGNNIRFIPCIAEDGTYKLTIKVEGINIGGAAVDEKFRILGSQVRIRINGGPWRYYTYGENGLTLGYGKLPEGTKFEVQNVYLNGFNELSVPLTADLSTSSITLKGKNYPACFKKCDGDPIFKMYLLTRDDSYCILVSDLHPSVESQKALCFPGTDWVATNTACEGWVCNTGCWDCDYLGFSRFSLEELWPIYQRRGSR